MNKRHFPFWPKRLPYDLVYPQTPLFELLETSARRYPDHTAIINYGKKISYRELCDFANYLAGSLSRMGISKGDRVGIYMQNCPHYIISYFAILRANAVIVPLNPMLVKNELQKLVQDSGTKILITTSELFAGIQSNWQELEIENVIVGSIEDYLPQKPSIKIPDFVDNLPQIPSDVDNWQDLLNKMETPPKVAVGSDDLCLLPYTAGSTGTPKGCKHTHATVISNVCSSSYWLNVTPASIGLGCLPFFHVTGMVHAFLAPIFSGGTNALVTRWDREAAMQYIEKYGVTHWVNITTMLVDSLSAPDIEDRDMSSLMVVGGGGAPLPTALGEKFKKLTGLDYVEGYGLTETISQTHFNPPDNVKFGSIGIPDFGVDSRIVDPSTQIELGPEEEGEIVLRGPEVFHGYWNKPEQTKETFLELEGKPFFRTGDIGLMDKDGYFFVIDRLKRMINVSGFKVWPAEIESWLYQHPAVKECCVIGVIDPKQGEAVKAVIVLNSDYQNQTEKDEIINWCKERMSAYKYPRIIEFTDSLPKSGTGKILWRELQENEKSE